MTAREILATKDEIYQTVTCFLALGIGLTAAGAQTEEVREKSLKTALDLMQQIRFIINELPGRQVDETTFGQMCALAIYQYADWLGMNGAMPMDQLTALALMKSQGKPQ